MHTLRAACEAMGTRFEMVLCGLDRAQLRAVAEEGLEEIARLDRRWNRYSAASELSELNRRAAREPVRVSGDLVDLLRRAREVWQVTEGRFDPALGNLLEYWRLRGEAGPSAQADEGLPEALAAAGMEHVAVEPNRREVRFARKSLQLDLGAVGKGYALDIAAELCREQGIEVGLIHAGTSSVVAIGPGSGEGWRIGIPTVEAARRGWTAAMIERAPREDLLLGLLELRDCALAVAAPWGQRIGNNKSGVAHILDPRTGRPAGTAVMAAAVTPEATEADALATALIVGGVELQAKIAARKKEWRTLVVIWEPTAGAYSVVNRGVLPEREHSWLV